jgi:glycosyltransferase involved in cell wall biosynthesis
VKIAYVLNSFADGGAELGLLTLVENGFFAGHDLSIRGLVAGSGTVLSRLVARVGADRVRALIDAPALRSAHLPLAGARLRSVFRRERPDVVILSLPQANLVGRIAARGVPRATVVSFEHNAAYKRKATKHLMRATARGVDAVFYDHPATWRGVRPFLPNIADDAAHYVPLTLLEPAAEPLSIPREGRHRLLTTMRLEPEKNHLELLHALRALTLEGHDLELTIAGDGSMRPTLEAAIDELDLRDRVTMTGFLTDLQPLRRSSHVFVCSSTNEGLCRNVLEALADGMLVVSTDVGGIRDYGVDGGNMIKAEGFGRNALGGALRRAIALGGRAAKIQRAGLALIDAEFSPRVVQRRWDRALEAIVPSPARGRPDEAGIIR